MTVKFVDIHSHVLPYVDDGADDWDCAIEMLKNAESEGIIAIVATPHILSENDFKSEEHIIKIYQELVQRARQEKLSIKIYLGCEIYAQHDTSLEHKIATINSNNKFFLIEFPMSNIPRFVPDKFFDFVVNDRIPIVAHPERNIGFQKRPELVYEFVQRGALMQINEGSLRGRYGELARLLTLKMISNNLVHFIASDGHKLNNRAVTLIEAYKVVVASFGKKVANKLFYDNPLKAINGKNIDIGSPIPIEGDLKPKFWQRVKIFKKRLVSN